MPSPKMPLSPMLVQYLVGLCALKWDPQAVNVILGDMVQDEASGSARDVDVTVTVDAPDGRYAFKSYEVKHEGTSLDVSEVEALVTKLNDMPSITHRAIVSTSGFSPTAIAKAAHHGIDLYAIKEWTRPLGQQFPSTAPGGRPPAETMRLLYPELIWLFPPSEIKLTTPGAPPFTVGPDGPLYGPNKEPHSVYRTFRKLQTR